MRKSFASFAASLNPALRKLLAGLTVLAIALSLAPTQELLEMFALEEAQAFTVNNTLFTGRTRPILQGSYSPEHWGQNSAGWQPTVLAASNLVAGVRLRGVISGNVDWNGSTSGGNATCRDGINASENAIPKHVAIGQFTDNNNNVVAYPGSVAGTNAFLLRDFESANGVLVPAGATKLWVSRPDSGYSDNTGDCNFSLEVSPIGSLDVANCSTVSGWAFDPDAGASPISVALYDGATGLTNMVASANRPDLTAVVGSAGHGFTFDVSGFFAPNSGAHQVKVYGLNVSNGQNRQLSNSPININCNECSITSVQQAISLGQLTFNYATPEYNGFTVNNNTGCVIPYTIALFNLRDTDSNQFLTEWATGTIAAGTSTITLPLDAGCRWTQVDLVYGNDYVGFYENMSVYAFNNLVGWGTNGLSAYKYPFPPYPTPICVTQAPALSPSVTPSPTYVNRGASVTYTMSVTNNGNAPAYGVEMRHPIPPLEDGTVIVLAKSSGCTQQGNTVVCPIGTLNAGASASKFMTLKAGNTGPTIDPCDEYTTSPMAGEMTVVANGLTPQVTPDYVDVYCVPVLTPELTIDKTALSPTVEDGSAIGFSITVANVGDYAAESVQIIDTPSLPGNTIAFNSASGAPCSNNAGTVTCNLGNMNAGTQKTVTLFFNVGTAGPPCVTGTITNDANAQANNASTVSDSASVAVTCDNQPGMSIQKTVLDNTVNRGDIVWYEIRLHNTNASHTLQNVTFTDTIPTIANGNMTFANVSPFSYYSGCSAAGGFVTCNVGTLGATDKVISVAYIAGSATNSCTENTTTVVNGTLVTGDADVIDPVSATGPSVSVFCPPRVPNLSVTKRSLASSVISRGETASFEVTVTSTGNATAENVSLTDLAQIPDGYAYFTGTPPAGCGYYGNQVSCSFAALTPGQSKVLRFDVIAGDSTDACVPLSRTPLSNAVTVSATNVSPKTASATRLVECPPLPSNAFYIDNISYGPLMCLPETITTLTSDPNPSEFGELVTLTATVESQSVPVDGGAVYFKEGSVVLGSGAVANGVATFATGSTALGTISVGEHNMRAYYVGNGTYGPSTSTVHVHLVTGGSSSSSSSSSSVPSSSSSSSSSVPSSSSSSSVPSSSSSSSVPSSSSSSISPTGADFFVFSIEDPAQIQWRGELETGQGIEDVAIGAPGRVTVASPTANHALMVIDVTIPDTPALELFVNADKPGTAAAIVPEFPDGLSGLTFLGTSESGAILFPTGPDENPNPLLRHQLSDNFTVSRARLDPTGCYAFMAVDSLTGQLRLARVQEPVSANIVQTFPEVPDATLGKGTSVLHHPWGTGDRDRLFFVSENALSILGPSTPGDGTCQ